MFEHFARILIIAVNITKSRANVCNRNRGKKIQTNKLKATVALEQPRFVKVKIGAHNEKKKKQDTNVRA